MAIPILVVKRHKKLTSIFFALFLATLCISHDLEATPDTTALPTEQKLPQKDARLQAKKNNRKLRKNRRAAHKRRKRQRKQRQKKQLIKKNQQQKKQVEKKQLSK